MWIKYIIPEDGDEHTHPNIYQLNQANGEVKVSDITSSFPVPGKYHFRFLKTVGNLTVWLDSPEANASAPSFQGSIFVKASRITSVEGNGIQSNFTSAPERPAPPVKPLIDEQIFDNSPPPAATTTRKSFGDDDLLGLSSNMTSSSSKGGASTTAPDPFGFDTLQPTSNLTPTSSSANISSMNPLNNSSRGSTASPMPGAMNSAMRNPPPMAQGSYSAMGGGMNPMSAGMGSMNPMNRGPMGAPPMGQAGNSRGFDPFDNLNSGFGNQQQQQSQYGGRGGGGSKRNY